MTVSVVPVPRQMELSVLLEAVLVKRFQKACPVLGITVGHPSNKCIGTDICFSIHECLCDRRDLDTHTPGNGIGSDFDFRCDMARYIKADGNILPRISKSNTSTLLKALLSSISIQNSLEIL